MYGEKSGMLYIYSAIVNPLPQTKILSISEYGEIFNIPTVRKRGDGFAEKL